MKYLLYIWILSGSISVCIAQTKISKKIEVSANQSIVLNFDDVSIVNVSEWQENYINIEANVNINENTKNDAFDITQNNADNQLIINGIIKNKDQLPQIIRIKKGDEIFSFQTDKWDDPKIQKFYEEHGHDDIQWKSHGISWEIDVQIKIPVGKTLQVNSKHGIIELLKMSGNVEANSIHGGVDVTIDKSTKTEIHAKTRWGIIYSNVVLDIDKSLSSNADWNHIVAKTSGGKSGPVFDLESKHANIYLRY